MGGNSKGPLSRFDAAAAAERAAGWPNDPGPCVERAAWSQSGPTHDDYGEPDFRTGVKKPRNWKNYFGTHEESKKYFREYRRKKREEAKRSK